MPPILSLAEIAWALARAPSGVSRIVVPSGARYGVSDGGRTSGRGNLVVIEARRAGETLSTAMLRGGATGVESCGVLLLVLLSLLMLLLMVGARFADDDLGVTIVGALGA